jgi:transposase
MNDDRVAKLLRELGARDEALAAREAELTAHQTELATQKTEVRRLSDELRRAELQIRELKQKLDALARRMFGKQSEQLDAQQLLLLFQEITAPGPAVGKDCGPELSEAFTPSPGLKARRRPRATPRVPENLPVLEETIVPPVVQACPEAYRRIGEEVTELLDYEAARFFLRRTVRPTYVKRAEPDAVPTTAPLPDRVLERGIAAPGLLAQIVVSKYCDHLPLYRQEYIYESRFGVYLPRQTMARWMGEVAYWLKPIAAQIGQEVMAGGYVQIDETPINYLEPGHGQTKQGYLWACSRPGHDVVYHWHISRAATCLEKIVPVDFAGLVQCDGYQAYNSFAKGRGAAITLAGCLAHARRYFFEAREEAPRVDAWILLHLKNLYKIEARLREARAGPRLRQAVRASESRMIHERLHRALVRLKTTNRYLPQSLMGQAIDYALKQWPQLSVYLEDGRVEIDNNLVENAIRPTALGKKNWLFFGEAEAGERGAIIYTVIESCRRRGIDPFAYLRDVLTRLPHSTNWEVKDLTPAAWAKEQAKHKAALRAAA